MTDPRWSELSAALRETADRLEALSDTDLQFPSYVSLMLTGGYQASQASLTVPVVDAIAEIFAVPARTKFEGRGADRRGQHHTEAMVGPLRIRSYTTVPVPPTRAKKLADLQRENDELREQLAARGGAA